MAKTIRVSEAFHALLGAHNRDDETMEETLHRLIGGPDPNVLAEVIGSDDATTDEMRRAIARKRERGRDRRTVVRERFE